MSLSPEPSVYGRVHAAENPPAGGEWRLRGVVALTVAMMVLEVAGGLFFGSKALLADGRHMGTHAAALGTAAFAYAHARKNARSERYCFGTGRSGRSGDSRARWGSRWRPCTWRWRASYR